METHVPVPTLRSLVKHILLSKLHITNIQTTQIHKVIRSERKLVAVVYIHAVLLLSTGFLDDTFSRVCMSCDISVGMQNLKAGFTHQCHSSIKMLKLFSNL